MQINISDRGAVILAGLGLVVAALVFAPDAVAGVLDGLASAVSGVSD